MSPTLFISRLHLQLLLRSASLTATFATDGIDVSDPGNPNRSFHLGHLLTGDIERIEALRRFPNGLYGADSLGANEQPDDDRQAPGH